LQSEILRSAQNDKEGVQELVMTLVSSLKKYEKSCFIMKNRRLYLFHIAESIEKKEIITYYFYFMYLYFSTSFLNIF